jgi:hypothetical protein
MRILDRTSMTYLLAACLLAAACGSKSGAAAVPLPDAGVDAGALADAGGDAAPPADTAQPDAAQPDAVGADAVPADSIPPDSAGPDAADTAVPDTAAPDSGDTTKWYACAADADCGAVEIMCCDHCNGGKAVAANKLYSAEVKAALGAKDCAGVACTEMACAPVQTACQLGTCIIAGSAQACQPAEAAVLCVRGKPVGGKEQLAVGDVVEVLVHPKGCFSSSCTKAVQSSCAITGSDGDFKVTANFCLANTSNGGPCTADCGGGGFAVCTSGTWTAGTHAVSLGGVSVTVTVPGEVPAGGACAGSQF